MKQEYLRWAIENTRTAWWNDSIEPGELSLGISRGAVGATSNPFLSHAAISASRQGWSGEIEAVTKQHLKAEEKAEALMRIAVSHAAEKLRPHYDQSDNRMGYVCAQVNPNWAGDRELMLGAARRFRCWTPNIAVKLPATAAGIDVLETCAAEGITTALTISYTVPQVLAVAQAYRKGIARAKAARVEPGRCFAVIMIGRLDDYLRDLARDAQADITESDIRQAGLAVTKRAYSIIRDRKYEIALIVAALRGTHHMTELAGAEIIMSIAPPYQEMLLSPDLPHEERIGAEVPAETIERLSQLPEFVRAYEPDGMKPSEFISYGVTQRTLTQFHESGWKLLESFR
jgi:transaldolase